MSRWAKKGVLVGISQGSLCPDHGSGLRRRGNKKAGS
jgi:hypothetical protein